MSAKVIWVSFASPISYDYLGFYIRFNAHRYCPEKIVYISRARFHLRIGKLLEAKCWLN